MYHSIAQHTTPPAAAVASRVEAFCSSGSFCPVRGIVGDNANADNYRCSIPESPKLEEESRRILVSILEIETVIRRPDERQH